MLELNQVCFAFQNQIILNCACLKLRQQSITCLLGGNGSGKTTLFNLITGFLTPQSGNVQLGNRDITHLTPFRIAQMGVARTFQDLRLIDKLTVRENVLLSMPGHPGERLGWALMPRGFQRERDATDFRKSDALLAEYFLTDVAGHLASDISYGQQKLLTVACCAAMEANLLLLDEPVAGVSPEYRQRIAERIIGLKTSGKTILLIEHQQDFLEQAGDTFLYLQDGRIHHFDAFSALRAAPVARHALN